MTLKKRIGIIAGKIFKYINRQQLVSILAQGYSMGFSADVFNLNEEFYDEKVTEGELNQCKCAIQLFCYFSAFLSVQYTVFLW